MHQEIERATQTYKAAALKKLSSTQFLLAFLYINGQGVKRDLQIEKIGLPKPLRTEIRKYKMHLKKIIHSAKLINVK